MLVCLTQLKIKASMVRNCQLHLVDGGFSLNGENSVHLILCSDFLFVEDICKNPLVVMHAVIC